MKVYIGYQCYYDNCDVWRTLVKVFDDETKALVWQEDMKPTEHDWREYAEMDVE